MRKKLNLKELLSTPDTISEKFHQQTKLKFFDKKKDALNQKFFGPNTIQYKGYGRLPEIKLPRPAVQIKSSLSKTLIQRKSVRDFSRKPMTLSYLSNLLYYSAGLNRKAKKVIVNRFYPSAGARYPLEVYLIAQNVKNLPRGLYHYYLKNHSLEELLLVKDKNHLFSFNQSFLSQSSLIIIITAVFDRITVKYGQRGYRHILIEAGHLGQNIYLLSSALCLGCCAIGGYIDDKLNELLDIDGTLESVVYVLTVGAVDKSVLRK